MSKKHPFELVHFALSFKDAAAFFSNFHCYNSGPFSPLEERGIVDDGLAYLALLLCGNTRR